MAAGTVLRNMYTLKSEMMEALEGTTDDGSDTTLSLRIGYPVQAHHCISCSVMQEVAKKQVAKLAKQSGYDINNGNNGLALPKYFGHMKLDKLQRHSGGHSEEYYKHVADELMEFHRTFKDADCEDEETKQDILDALQNIENKIRRLLTGKKPSWWLYSWSEELYDGDYRDEGTGDLKALRPRDTSNESGKQWLNDYRGQVKRRYKVVKGKNVVRAAFYEDEGYPVPGSLR